MDKYILWIKRHIIVIPKHYDGNHYIIGLGHSLQFVRAGSHIRITNVMYANNNDLIHLLDILMIYANIIGTDRVYVIDTVETELYAVLTEYGFVDEGQLLNTDIVSLSYYDHFHY